MSPIKLYNLEHFQITLCLPINFYLTDIKMECSNVDENEQRIYVKYRTLLEIPKEDIQNDLVKIHGDAAIKILREQKHDSETLSEQVPQPEIEQGDENITNSQNEVNKDANQDSTVLVTNESTISTNDPDMDAILQHQRLPNTILRHKATVANKQRRMPSFKKSAAPKISIKNTNDFFDIEDFLEINPDFSKIKTSQSDEELECQVRERKKDPLTEEMRNSKILKRYSMPPVRSQSYRIPNSYPMQPRMISRAQTDDNDSSSGILRKKREMQHDDSITSISENETALPPKPILRNKPALKNSEKSEANQSKPCNTEFMQRASKVRQSWGGQTGGRIEKLLNKTPYTNENSYKRHSVYISNGISALENRPKPPTPGPKPKSPAKLVKINNSPKAIIPDAPKGKEGETKSVEIPKELQNEFQKAATTPSKVENNETENASINETLNESIKSPKEIPEPNVPSRPNLPIGYSKAFENTTDDEMELFGEKVPGSPKEGEKPKITRPKPTISRKPRVQKNARTEIPIVKPGIDKSSNIAKAVQKEVIENKAIDQKSVENDARIDKNSTSSDDNQKKPKLSDNSHEINGTMNRSQDRESPSMLCNGQNSNNSNCSSINKNNHPQVNNSSFRKEKPIFAFLKAKEETNQQSFNTSSQMNRAFLSSGITPAGIEAKDKDSFNSKPIIPQPKIITY